MHAPFSFAMGIVVVEEDVVSLLRAIGVAALRALLSYAWTSEFRL